MASTELAHLSRVVVLVDDLDRCLYLTVVDTLETICLFLAVPKMAFVIAADERRVADALRDRFPHGPTGRQRPDGQPEHVPIPCSAASIPRPTSCCSSSMHAWTPPRSRPTWSAARRCAVRLAFFDDLPDIDASLDISVELTLASRLTPILYEKLRGDPRTLAALFSPITFHFIEMLGIAAGWRCWEAGAGGPTVPAWPSAPAPAATCWPLTAT